MVYRDIKDKNYTIISNKYLRDISLSLKAKGLLSLMLSLPESWTYSTNGLCSITKESKNTIHSILKELECAKYLKRKMIRNKKGIIVCWNYDIYESPYLNNQDMDFPNIDNLPILNKKEESKEKKDKIDKSRLNSITLELIRRNYLFEDSNELSEYNLLFNELIKYYDYYMIVIAVNYVISKMKNKTLDEEGKPIVHKYLYFKESLINNLKKLSDTSQLFEN